MTKALYFDCFSGISGDMILGALLDLGLDEKKVISEIKKLNIDGYDIQVNKIQKYAISGTDVEVILTDEQDPHDHQHSHSDHERNLSDIKEIILNSGISEPAKRLSIEIFTEIAEAEKEVHGKPLDQVYFHEVGAVDSIVDIVGAAICIDMLNIDAFYCSALKEGQGFVKCRHGEIPVPVPAVLEILSDSGLTITATDKIGELITPTGAAIVKVLAKRSQQMPAMNIKKAGYGFGKRETGTLNALRLVIGTLQDSSLQDAFLYDYDTVSEIQCNIDDMTGESLGFLMEHLFKCGALDVFFTPVQMKKNRPAVMLTVLASDVQEPKIIDELFKYSSSIGLRVVQKKRMKLFRESRKMLTPWGQLWVKVSYDSKRRIIKQKPEYDKCIQLAVENNITFEEISDWVSSHR